VLRRDFTINGLLLDPVSQEVLDYVGGQRDLEAGLVRAIGRPEQRFSEDKLRMMRGVRFAARFDYALEGATFAALQKLAPQIRQVSNERMRDELTKMLTEGRARNAFLLLDEGGLLAEVLPEIAAMKGVEQPPQFHPEGDVFLHTLHLLEKLPAGSASTLAWGALLHDVGKPPTFRVAPDRIRFDGHVEVGARMAREICLRLRFSNRDSEQIVALVENHMRFAAVRSMKDSTFKRFVRMPGFAEHLELHRLDCLSSHNDLTLYQFTRDRRMAMPPEAIQPKPLISGADLIGEGYAPGPVFRQILSAVEDAQLDGRLESKDAALELVRERFPLGS
jgi:poly(A) polymerase